jgi:hypothetical protein
MPADSQRPQDRRRRRTDHRPAHHPLTRRTLPPQGRSTRHATADDLRRAADYLEARQSGPVVESEPDPEPVAIVETGPDPTRLQLHRARIDAARAEAQARRARLVGSAPTRPEPSPTAQSRLVLLRHYASGWLAAGAGAVFGFQWGTKVNYADALANTDSTVDQLFMKSLREYVGWNDLYFESQRTPGALSHLDPDPDNGYLRAVTGNLEMTTDMWRSGADQIAPAINASL